MEKILIVLGRNKIVTESLKRVFALFGYEVYTVIEEIFEIVFEQERTVEEYTILMIDGDRGSDRDNKTQHIWTAISVWQELLEECTNDKKSFKFIISRDIVPLTQMLNQEEERAESTDNLDPESVQSMKDQLIQGKLCELQLTRELEDIIRKGYELRHDQPNFDFASTTRYTRYLFYFLAWRFQKEHQLRFLIIDNKDEDLQKWFGRLGIHTCVVDIPKKGDGASDSEKRDWHSDGDCIYFLNFQSFRGRLEGIHDTEKRRKEIREIFKRFLSDPHDNRFIFDGIVLDIFLGMADFTGIDILQALKNDDEQFYYRPKGGLDNIPIIMLSGLSDEGHIIESIDKGADWYIPKFKYKNHLIESLKEIPVTFYRLYLRRQELQNLFIKIFEYVCDVDLEAEDYKVVKCRLDQIQKQIQELRRKDVPKFLSTFFQSLAQITESCQSILNPGLQWKDWVEVKSASESILGELDKISHFNDVYCFENCKKSKEYLQKSGLGRDNVRVHYFIDEDINKDRKLNFGNLGGAQPPLLSAAFRQKVAEMIRFANKRIRSLSLQRRPEVV